MASVKGKKRIEADRRSRREFRCWQKGGKLEPARPWAARPRASWPLGSLRELLALSSRGARVRGTRSICVIVGGLDRGRRGKGSIVSAPEGEEVIAPNSN